MAQETTRLWYLILTGLLGAMWHTSAQDQIPASQFTVTDENGSCDGDNDYNQKVNIYGINVT
ncbi:unnamed protein product, partial [Callosobruchus maculatus]